MKFALVKLAIVRKFFRGANLSWVNVESCFTARLTWPLMDRRRTNQLLGLGRDIISTMVAMGKYTERMGLPFNGFCRGCRTVKEQKTVLHFLCQCPSFARCRYRLLDISCQLAGAIIYWHHGYSFVYKTFWLVFQCGVAMPLIGSRRADQLLLFWLMATLNQYMSCYCVLKWTLWYQRSHSDLNDVRLEL